MPWFVAVLRDHHRRLMIGLLTLLLGWTLLGWLVAFLWAVSATRGVPGREKENEAGQASTKGPVEWRARLGTVLATHVALAVGGVLGVYARYGLTRLDLYGKGFPLGTLIINLLGTFLLAFLFILTLERVTISPAVRTGILTGGLGAFTTFSTFIMEALILIDDGQAGKAALYLALSIGFGIVVAFGAVYIARNIGTPLRVRLAVKEDHELTGKGGADLHQRDR